MEKVKKGRKSKYDTHVAPRLQEIEWWCREGLTEIEICKRLDVAESTFNNYKREFSELMESLKKGKEIADYQVEDALFKRAVGYEYTERTAKVVERDPEVVEVERRDYEHRYKLDNPEAKLQEIKDAAIKAIPTRERIVLLEVDKQVSPDTGAIALWLKNRKRDSWQKHNSIDEEFKKEQIKLAKAQTKSIENMLDEESSDAENITIVDSWGGASE